MLRSRNQQKRQKYLFCLTNTLSLILATNKTHTKQTFPVFHTHNQFSRPIFSPNPPAFITNVTTCNMRRFIAYEWQAVQLQDNCSTSPASFITTQDRYCSLRCPLNLTHWKIFNCQGNSIIIESVKFFAILFITIVSSIKCCKKNVKWVATESICHFQSN